MRDVILHGKFIQWNNAPIPRHTNYMRSRLFLLGGPRLEPQQQKTTCFVWCKCMLTIACLDSEYITSNMTGSDFSESMFISFLNSESQNPRTDDLVELDAWQIPVSGFYPGGHDGYRETRSRNICTE